MDFLFYYVLRRFFAEVRFSPRGIYLRKGALIRRESVVPLETLTHVEVKRSPLLRIFRAKAVTVHSLGGSISFFLADTEPLPFLPENRGAAIRPKTRLLLLGAFSDTRALSGVVVFSGTLSRIGRLLGSEYYDRIIAAITDVADELAGTLLMVHIAVPRITAVAAVFAAAAWVFAFLGRFIELLRFRVCSDGKFVTVRRGIVTLYEQTLVLNNLNAVVSERTVVTSLLGVSPLYVRGVMIFPPANNRTSERAARTLCRVAPAKKKLLKPPLGALFGHCAAPLGFGAGFLAALLLCHFGQRFGLLPRLPVIRSLLWCGAAVCGWLTFSYALFMRGSFLAVGNGALTISARRGGRLVSALIPRGQLAAFQNNVSLFQRRRGLRDISVSAKQGGAIKLRHAGLLL